MNLNIIETELKKRCEYEYKWGRKQNDEWDLWTNFIYKIDDFDNLFKSIKENYDIFCKKYIDEEEFKNYALNRWFSFWSAEAIQQIFCSVEYISPNKDKKDKLIDFTIKKINFDHKTSVFPRGFGKDIRYAQDNKKELIEWLYNNQSQQGRKHLKNRLFIVVYDTKSNNHWKLKAEINWLKKLVLDYSKDFNEENLVKPNLKNNEETLSDIIWAIKY